MDRQHVASVGRGLRPSIVQQRSRSLRSKYTLPESIVRIFHRSGFALRAMTERCYADLLNWIGNPYSMNTRKFTEGGNFIFRAIVRFDPAVDRRYLILTAGLVWSIVGTGLCTVALRWLVSASETVTMELGLASLILAVLIATFGFPGLVHQNLERILSKPGKACLFSFHGGVTSPLS